MALSLLVTFKSFNFIADVCKVKIAVRKYDKDLVPNCTIFLKLEHEIV